MAALCRRYNFILWEGGFAGLHCLLVKGEISGDERHVKAAGLTKAELCEGKAACGIQAVNYA